MIALSTLFNWTFRSFAFDCVSYSKDDFSGTMAHKVSSSFESEACVASSHHDYLTGERKYWIIGL